MSPWPWLAGLLAAPSGLHASQQTNPTCSPRHLCSSTQAKSRHVRSSQTPPSSAPALGQRRGERLGHDRRVVPEDVGEVPLPVVDDAMTVEVLDRGPGVPAGEEERIFDKFHRAGDSLDSGIEGSGLGLTLARQIARAHGGEVSYSAREGGGSIFTCTLPLLNQNA